MAADADFASKFGLVLKAFNLSRGRVAQVLGIDKSVVSRWASGVQAPSDHNLSLLTEAIARHKADFRRVDWDLAPAALAARLGLDPQASAADASAAAMPALKEPKLTPPDKPSIAVLPFQNMSGDREQEYFADGVVEEIITALSRFKSLFVIARNSSFTYKGKAVDIKLVGRDLGVRYVLEGSIRKAGGRVRLTAQLIDAESGAHLWADRFESPLEDIFELQDQLTASVVGAIAPKLDRAEMERARRKPVENLDAYDCFLRGMAHTYEQTRESFEEALRLFYRAIELDSGFSTPYGMAARCYGYRKTQGWMVDKDREQTEVRRLALRVSQIGADDALALCWAGQALAFVCFDHDRGAALVDQALALNPNLAIGWINRAAVSMYAGEHEAAREQIVHALRLSPLDPETPRSEGIVAATYFYQGRYEESLQWAARALGRWPDWMTALRTSAVANALAGNVDQARQLMAQMLQIDPAMRLSNVVESLPFRRPQDIERMLSALRIAGLPE